MFMNGIEERAYIVYGTATRTAFEELLTGISVKCRRIYGREFRGTPQRIFVFTGRHDSFELIDMKIKEASLEDVVSTFEHVTN